MYNPELKEQFLSQYEGGTKTTYRFVLEKTESEEKRLGIDLYNFSIEDIKRVLTDMRPQSLSSSSSNGRIISSYIGWAGRQLLSNTSINPLAGYGDDFYKQFMTGDKLYYSEEEIMELEDALVNYQDQVSIRLLFEGVKVDELLNLTKRNIDYENGILKLKDDEGNIRDFKLWEETKERTLKFIQGALSQTQYFNKNDTVENSRRATSQLVETDYVIRKSKTNSKDIDKSAYSTIIKRFAVIKKVFGDFYTMTPKKIEQSGMLKMGKDLLLRDGKLERDQLLEIGERFNKMRLVKGYLDTTEIKKIVNLDNIKELYPEIF